MFPVFVEQPYLNLNECPGANTMYQPVMPVLVPNNGALQMHEHERRKEMERREKKKMMEMHYLRMHQRDMDEMMGKEEKPEIHHWASICDRNASTDRVSQHRLNCFHDQIAQHHNAALDVPDKDGVTRDVLSLVMTRYSQQLLEKEESEEESETMPSPVDRPFTCFDVLNGGDEHVDVASLLEEDDSEESDMEDDVSELSTDYGSYDYDGYAMSSVSSLPSPSSSPPAPVAPNPVPHNVYHIYQVQDHNYKYALQKQQQMQQQQMLQYQQMAQYKHQLKSYYNAHAHGQAQPVHYAQQSKPQVYYVPSQPTHHVPVQYASATYVYY